MIKNIHENNLKAIDQFIKENSRRFSDETIKSYKLSLMQFFFFIRKEYVDIKRRDITAWHQELDDRGLEINSIRLKLSALRSFFRCLKEDDLIEKDYAKDYDFPVLNDVIVPMINDTQRIQLFELANEDKRKRAIVEMLFCTGLRISELLNIELQYIKWDKKQIWIHKGKRDKERYVLFNDSCKERLKHYLASRNVDSKYLFCNQKGNKLSSSWVRLFFKEYSEELGMRITPHSLRRAFAVYLYTKGMPTAYIQEMMGHKSINSTLRYIKLSDKALKEGYDKYY